MSVPELGTCEVTNASTSGDAVIVGTVEVDSVPLPVSTEKVVCESPREKRGLVPEEGAAVTASERVSGEVAGPEAPEGTGGVATAELVRAPGPGTNEAVVSGPLLNGDGVVPGTAVLVIGSRRLVARDDVASGAPRGAAEVVWAASPDIWSVRTSEVGMENQEMKMGVEVVFSGMAVVSALPVLPVAGPGSWGTDTQVGQHDRTD